MATSDSEPKKVAKEEERPLETESPRFYTWRGNKYARMPDGPRVPPFEHFPHGPRSSDEDCCLGE